MKLLSFVGLILISTLVFANEHGGGAGHDEIPLKTIMYQSINVTILFAGLFYFLKNPVKSFFKEKKELFLSAAQKAQEAKAAAEEEHLAIQVKLTKLESTADESISRARAEAADLKKQLIQEAHTISKRIKSEAEAAAKLEIEKAKNKLREDMILEATKLARAQFVAGVSADDHKRLQGDFIDNIKAVQP